MKRISAILTVVVSLLLVGLIRSATADLTPTEYDVLPDESGVGHQAEYTVAEQGFWMAAELTHESSWYTERLTTDNVFVVMRAQVTPHHETLLAAVNLETADGYTYSSLSVYPFPYLSVAYVGQTTTTHYVFELPRDKVEGAYVTFHGLRRDGIQPLWPRLRFDVVDPEPVDVFNVPADEVGPR